jgi:hypothetical protein
VDEALAASQAWASTWGLGLLEVFHGLVRRLVAAFESAGLDYMFTGALAASFYGIARTTVDVDVVVHVAGRSQRVGLVSALRQAGLKVDERVVEKAFKSNYKIASFRDSKSSYSVDVIFSRGRLVKRVGAAAGVSTFFQAPEDLVLAKLRMIKATVPRSRALKDEEDVRAILKFTKVDVEAVRKKAKKESTLLIFDSVSGST